MDTRDPTSKKGGEGKQEIGRRGEGSEKRGGEEKKRQGRKGGLSPASDSMISWQR